MTQKYNDLGAQLKALRKQSKLTQAEAAQVIGVARTTMVAIEQGKRKVKAIELADLLSTYSVDESSINFEAVKEQAARIGFIHIFVGHSAGKRKEGEHCLYCATEPAVGAYTYFGAFVCPKCWDEYWRQSEDGEHDPPFAEIVHQVSGYWL